MKKHLLTAAVVALALTATGADTASAGPRPNDIAVKSTFTDTSFLTSIDSLRCGALTEDTCELRYHSHSRLHGTLDGWTDYSAWMRSNLDGTFTWYSDETFTGTVAGCGIGTFRFLVQDGTIEPDSANPAIQHFAGTWAFVPGSGTGDLARIVAGSGRDEGDGAPDGSTSGTFTGTISCDR